MTQQSVSEWALPKEFLLAVSTMNDCYGAARAIQDPPQTIQDPPSSFDNVTQDDVKKWERCLDTISLNIQDQSYETWFSDLRVLSFSDAEVVIVTISKDTTEWLYQNYIGLIKTAIHEAHSIRPKVTILTDTDMTDVVGEQQPNDGAIERCAHVLFIGLERRNYKRSDMINESLAKELQNEILKGDTL